MTTKPNFLISDSKFNFAKSVRWILIIVQLSFIITVSNAQINFAEESWEEIIEKADDENKLIFIAVCSDWAGPCKWMEKNVYNQKEVGTFYNTNFINVKVDSESPFGKSIKEINDLKKVPSFLFIDASEKEIYKLEGKHTSAKFINLGEVALRMKDLEDEK